jgi:hypothetical protein
MPRRPPVDPSIRPLSEEDGRLLDSLYRKYGAETMLAEHRARIKKKRPGPKGPRIEDSKLLLEMEQILIGSKVFELPGIKITYDDGGAVLAAATAVARKQPSHTHYENAIVDRLRRKYREREKLERGKLPKPFPAKIRFFDFHDDWHEDDG